MTWVEVEKTPFEAGWIDVSVAGHAENEISYHVLLMQEAGLIEAIDVEQLVYLAQAVLCMLTSDSGFKSKVTESPQAGRIITVAPSDLMDATKTEMVLRGIF